MTSIVHRPHEASMGDQLPINSPNRGARPPMCSQSTSWTGFLKLPFRF